MDQITSEIPYVPPCSNVKDYAACAIRHLRTLERFDPRSLVSMLAPSNVLALAGLRSLSPYNDRLRFDIHTRKLDNLLSSYGLLWVDERPNVSDPELASYALVNVDVVDHLQECYPLQAVSATGPVLERSNWGFFAWQARLDIALARAMENDMLPKEWLEDWWNPHNIRFGMLLGYPGTAITSFVEAEVEEARWKHLETVTISPGLLNSADVSFAVAKKHRGGDDVATMVEVWRATLAEVYAVYSLDELMSNADLATTVQAKH